MLPYRSLKQKEVLPLNNIFIKPQRLSFYGACYRKSSKKCFFHVKIIFWKLRKLEYPGITKIEVQMEYKYASKLVLVDDVTGSGLKK